MRFTHDFGKGTVGVTQTFFNTFKCFVGIGILATPFAFGQVSILVIVISCIDWAIRRNSWNCYHWSN